MKAKLQAVAAADVEGLLKAEKNYGDSWKRRGGVGAFMMLARKWDRLERAVEKTSPPYDIAKTIAEDTRAEGVIDDIRDLRRYLMLVEAEWGVKHSEVEKDVPAACIGCGSALRLASGGACVCANPKCESFVDVAEWPGDEGQ